MDELKKRKISFTIMGNPFHLTDNVCKRLKESGCVRYQLSLDGMRQTHDWFRMPGSFDTTLSKIKTIKNAGIRAIIMTTVSEKNIDEIPDIIDTVVEHGADVFSFGRYVPSGEEGIFKIPDDAEKGTIYGGCNCADSHITFGAEPARSDMRQFRLQRQSAAK